MRIVRGVKIPERKKTSAEFRSKWLKIINSYTKKECQELFNQIKDNQKRRGQVEVEQRYLLVLLKKTVNSSSKESGDNQPLIAAQRPNLMYLFFPMTSQEVFNTFNSVIESSDSSPFLKQLAKAALIATPDDKALIMRTWPKVVQNFGPGSSLYKEAA